MASSVQIGLTMLPASRKTFLSQFLGINFDDGLKFHRLFGALSIWFARKSFMIGVDPRLRKYENYMGAFGVVSMILLAWGHQFSITSSLVSSSIPSMEDGVTRVMQTSRPHTLTSVSKEPNGYIRLEIANFSPKVKPGQWVSLNVPAIHKTDFHPFRVVGKDPKTDSLNLNR
ncbi:hypothetical protein HDU76_001282 [Blyttiomyces sp. JEL0837]|nr:hypothetical protein HDU76_001282 [Blyttiomyces sp. JEL0837]